MTLLGTPDALIKRRGKSFTLRRAVKAAGSNAWTEGAITTAYHTGGGFIRQFSPKEVRGTVQSGDMLLLLNSAFPTEPLHGDKIAVGAIAGATDVPGVRWLQVVDVYSPDIVGDRAVYRLHVRG